MDFYQPLAFLRKEYGRTQERSLLLYEQIVCQLLVKMFDRIAIDLVIDGADEDDFCRAHDDGDGKKSQDE